MSSKYDFDFGEDTAYGHAFELVSRCAQPGGVILDFGCGHGAIADRLAAEGFTYVGLDIDEEGVRHVTERGHIGLAVDVTDAEAMNSAIREATEVTEFSAFLALDIIEHIPDPRGFLSAMHHMSEAAGGPPLIISIPNVTHFDVGAKLVHGRWDVTATGLLDETHVGFYSSDRVTTVMEDAGWLEIDRSDLELFDSDQHFPPMHPGIAAGSQLSRYLARIGSRTNLFSRVNQFVRAYSPGVPPIRRTTEGTAPALSIITRTQGTRNDILSEALLCLAGQESDDFELLLMVHTASDNVVSEVRQLLGPYSPSFSRRVRIIKVTGGGRSRPLNKGLDAAIGDYVAFLDDDDLVTSDWTRTFIEGALESPGTVIRSVVADQEVHRTDGNPPYELKSGAIVDPGRVTFSFIRHLETNRTPICGFALPRVTLETYSLRFKEDLVVLEDWHLLLRVAAICGVHNMERVTSIYRRWDDTEASWHALERKAWSDTRGSVQLELDRAPILLPEGSVSEIAELIIAVYAAPTAADVRKAKQQLESAQRDLAASKKDLAVSKRRITALENSTSWRITAPIRGISSLFKRK